MIQKIYPKADLLLTQEELQNAHLGHAFVQRPAAELF